MRTIGRVRAAGGGRDLDAMRTGDAGRSPRGNETRHATRRMICDVDAMIVETDGKTGARRRWPRIRGPPRDPRRPCVRNARRSHHGSCRPRSLFYHIATTQLPCTWYGSHSPYPRRELYENTRVPLYQQVGDSRVRDEKGRHLLEGTINTQPRRSLKSVSGLLFRKSKSASGLIPVRREADFSQARGGFQSQARGGFGQATVRPTALPHTCGCVLLTEPGEPSFHAVHRTRARLSRRVTGEFRGGCPPGVTPRSRVRRARLARRRTTPQLRKPRREGKLTGTTARRTRARRRRARRATPGTTSPRSSSVPSRRR